MNKKYMFSSIFAAIFNPLFYIAGAFLSPSQHFQNIAAHEATSRSSHFNLPTLQHRKSNTTQWHHLIIFWRSSSARFQFSERIEDFIPEELYRSLAIVSSLEDQKTISSVSTKNFLTLRHGPEGSFNTRQLWYNPKSDRRNTTEPTGIPFQTP
jgi:hypothetical protein